MSNQDFEPLQNEEVNENVEEAPMIDLDDYDQDRDADFSNIKLGGRHLALKAPKKETESGIILSEDTRKQVQGVQDMPTFNEKVKVAAVGEKCELVEVGDMVLLSPHLQVLEMVEDNILYILVHEDYVLATKKGE